MLSTKKVEHRVNNGIAYVRVGDMNLEQNITEITESSTYYIAESVKNSDLMPVGSIIFPKRGGAIATNKKRFVLKFPILVDSNTMAAIPVKSICFYYFSLWFKNIDLATLGNASVVPQINNKDIEPLLIPLPPLAEQNAIVERVDRLLEFVNALELQVTERKSYAQQLMQAVLKEAFAG